MTDEKSKLRLHEINYKFVMFISLKWFLKTQVTTPVFYFCLLTRIKLFSKLILKKKTNWSHLEI